MFFGLVLALLSTPALAGEVIMDFLDVGQGDSVLIRGGGKAVLIDAGDRDSGVVDQLKILGVERIDLAVATHPHADHIGSMAQVIREFPVTMYMDNGLPHTTEVYKRVMHAVTERGVHRLRAKTDMTIRLGDEAILHVLFPGETYLKNTRSDLNSNSVVIWLEHGEIDALFTGDAEEPTESALLRAGIKEVELLKVAHHGSDHSSSSSFLSRVSPEIAVISCGEGNRYNHPGVDTLQRLASAGALVFRTDLSGQVRAVSDGAELDVLEGDIRMFAKAQLAVVPTDVPLFASVPVVQETPADPVLPTAVTPAVSGDVTPNLSGVRPSPTFEDEPTGRRKKKKKKKRGAE